MARINDKQIDDICLEMELGTPILKLVRKYKYSHRQLYDLYYQHRKHRFATRQPEILDSLIDSYDLEPFDENEWSEFGMIVIE